MTQAEPGSGETSARRPVIPIVRTVVICVGILLAIGFAATVIEPEHHADGNGPLSALPVGTRIGMAVARPPGGRVSFGVGLCLLRPGATATIESVGPTSAVGAGATAIGFLARTFRLGAGHDAVGSVDGFPPPTANPEDAFHQAIGFDVSLPCRYGGDATSPIPYTELVIGVQADGASGGGWHGIDIGYRFGGRHRTVTVAYDLCFTGSDVTGDCTNGSTQ